MGSTRINRIFFKKQFNEQKEFLLYDEYLWRLCLITSIRGTVFGENYKKFIEIKLQL